MNGRIVVMIAGGVILASVFVKSHPDMIANPPERGDYTKVTHPHAKRERMVNVTRRATN